MKSISLIRVLLRLIAIVLMLAAGGYLLRPKSPTAPKPVAVVAFTPPAPPTPIMPPAPDPYKPPPSKPLTGAWLHLKQAKLEQITFPGYSVRSTDTYDWLPDGRALLVRYMDKTNHCILLAASAKKVVSLEDFNRKYGLKLYADRSSTPGRNMDHLPPEVASPYCLLSPDGKRLLWLESSEVYISVGDTPRRPESYATASLDGNTRREWRYYAIAPNWNQDAGYFASDACWMRNSRNWITPYFKEGWWLGFALIDSRRSHSWRVLRFRDALRDNYHLLGEAQDGYILAEVSADAPSKRNYIVRFRLNASTAVSEKVALSPPLPGFLLEPVLSPGGDRLAWRIYEDKKMALWISSAKGKFSGLSTPVEIPATIEPGSLRWMPDGQHITFLKDGTLFKVALP